MYQSIFLNSINEFMITRRYAKRTIETYTYWIKRYIIFNDKQHPTKLGDHEVERYLTYLANTENKLLRHHIDESSRQKAIKRAAKLAQIQKAVSYAIQASNAASSSKA